MIFNNNQRQFAKENHADSNAMFRNGNRTIPDANHFENNSENL